MATNKQTDNNDEAVNPKVQEFLTDPKHQEQRDFMNALIDTRLNEKVNAAKTKTTQVGGSFIDNLIEGLTGNLFGEDK